MVSDASGGNWYRIWAVHTITMPQDDGSERVAVTPHVVIVTDDKTHPYEIECESDEQADALATDIANGLRKHERPLWSICGVTSEALPPDVLEYEMKRLQWYWKATDVR